MENGFPSPRNDAFPAGLRVLVVDDDPTWLKILEKMLKKCSYEVTTCCLAIDALDLLRERKDGFDIVVSDVNMPDMDGFKLLEHVGLEMDLPVIMMSVDGETSRVMKGVQHGACDYLLKPIRMKELRNIWQHVFRKRIHEVRDIESFESIEDIQMMRNGLDQSDDGHFLSGGDLTSLRKRKDFENKHDDKDFGDPSSTKKVRVVWTVDLHQKFVKAVNQIGFDKVGPKKILDLMNVPWLTRENVASHLQKYRLYLSRLQKDNDLRTSFGGVKHSDVSTKDPSGNFGVQNSINMHSNDSANGNYAFTSSNILVQNMDAKFHEGELKGIFSLPMTEPKKARMGDVPEPQKAGNLWMGFESLEPNANYAAFDSTTLPQYPWSREIQEIPFKPENKLHHHFVERLPPAPPIDVGPSIAERARAGPVQLKPLYANYRSNSLSKGVAPVRNAIDPPAFDPISLATFNKRSQGFHQNCMNNLESTQRNLFSLDDSNSANFGLQNIEYSDFNDPGLIAGVPIQLYDALRFGYDNPCESVEYPIIDQGLFIA